MSRPLSDAGGLEFRNVVRGYAGRQVLQGLTMQVPSGRIVALMGANGSGKSTAIGVAAGVLAPESGGAWIGTEPAWPATESLRSQVGTAWEKPPRNAGSRLFDVLMLGARLHRVPDPESAVGVTLERFGLTLHANVSVDALSHGLAKRAAVALAMLHRPRVLLLDEPTAGVDDVGVEIICGCVREFAAGGASVLVTTHDIDAAHALEADVHRLESGSTHPASVTAGEADMPRVIAIRSQPPLSDPSITFSGIPHLSSVVVRGDEVLLTLDPGVPDDDAIRIELSRRVVAAGAVVIGLEARQPAEPGRAGG